MAGKESTERATLSIPEPAHDDNALVVADSASYAALFHTDSPHATLERAQELVQYVAALIKPRRKDYIADFNGKQYAMHTYWSVYDMALGVTNDTSPVEPFEIPGHPDLEAFRCRVTLYMPDGKQLGSGEAICSADEKAPMGSSVWAHHALFSKTQTRAFVKAHRLAMSLIPLLDGLEPISYDEVVEPPLMFPGDEIDWNKIGERVRHGLTLLGWTNTKARARLSKFSSGDGTVNEEEAVAFLSAELAKQDAEAKR